VTVFEPMDTQSPPSSAVLVVDTCSLLDIVRAPVFDRVSPTDMVNALWIVDALQTRKTCFHLVVCDWVQSEYRRAIGGVEQDVRQQLEKVWASHNHAAKIAAAFEAQDVELVDARKCADTVISRGKQIVGQFLALAGSIHASEEDERRAGLRTKEARPPAHRGKGSMADAVITELALRLSNEMRSGLREPGAVVLLSSNTKDFCEGKVLKTDLQHEFEASGIEYAPTWSAARYACSSSSEGTPS